MDIINAATPATTLVAAPSAAPAPSTPTSNASGSTIMKAKVAIGFLNNDSDVVLVVVGNHVLASMAGNTSYPTPIPALATIATAQQAFASAVQSLDRGKASTLLRNKTRAALVQLLRALALYVQQNCQGDPVVLASSGFPAQKGRGKPVGLLHAPNSVRLRPGRVSGQMRALCNPQVAANSYQWQYATAQAPTAWTQSGVLSKTSYTLTALTPGTQYIAQARAIGSAGPSNWSDSATLMAT
jgi:hypothetical protein